jgi:glycosyltransferase involved in cell wall biosynthesis
VRDPRLVVERQARAGLAVALNRALGRARAPLIARLDADDIALPSRFERQRAFLQAHPHVGLLGTAARVVDESDRDVEIIRPPEDDRAIRRALIRRNPFVHSSVMLRRALVSSVGGYDEAFAVAQDYDLWLRLSPRTRMANLAEPLVIRRLVAGRVTAARDDARLRAEARARWHAVRAGAYPPWGAVFALRPLLALALPGPLRGSLRRALGR